MKYDKLLEQKITENIDKKYKEFYSQIVPKTEVKGVRVPILRKIAKDFSRYDDFLENVSLNSYEAINVACYYIGLKSKEIKTLNANLEFILPHINNWAVCDTFVSSLKILKTKRDDFYDTLNKCLISRNEFTVRFAIVCILTYYLGHINTTELFDKLILLQNKSYYIDMAIAWLISVAYIKCKEPTLNLLQNKRLCAKVQNLSISKICDSFRVGTEEKMLVKKLKY